MCNIIIVYRASEKLGNISKLNKFGSIITRSVLSLVSSVFTPLHFVFIPYQFAQ